MNYLKLTRPLAFFDLESTGTNTEKDRIVTIYAEKHYPENPYLTTVLNLQFNPQMPIPLTATAVHGISDEMVKEWPPISHYAETIKDYFDGCDLCTFNGNSFDIPLLYTELERNGHLLNLTNANFIDVSIIDRKLRPRKLGSVYEFYTGNELTNAHEAKADIEASRDTLFAQLENYPELPNTVEELALYCNDGKPMLDIAGKFVFDESGEIVFNFGEHKGKPVQNHHSYLHWMLKGTFNSDTKKWAKSFLAI